ncbi:hypothetical protein [Streptomyces sp. AC495_CC817]|uniref:hypothetical protein n=1 Tax=Streptomyces sp. AC495_CC817 TaxID=2823900 RepID=UPI001C273EDA|nr:hypothetical protein [Streptomyces sp. AC495_CC817]
MGEETANGAATARANASARAKVLGWARRTVDLIPTPWLVTGAGAVLLSTTAAFGGLATAPEDPIPEIAVGEVYTGADFEMAVVGVELWNEQGNSAIYPRTDEGEKVLVVAVDVTNTFDKPRRATSGEFAAGSVDAITVDGIDELPFLTYADDGGTARELQPDVPVRLLLAWRVGSDDFHDGDAVSLTLPDATHRVGDNVLRGVDLWEDVRVGATLTATVEEVSAP